jgi:hypothetical protein
MDGYHIGFFYCFVLLNSFSAALSALFLDSLGLIGSG